MAKKKQKKKVEKDGLKKVSKKEQIKSQNKTLRNFLIVLGSFIVLIFLVMFIFNLMNNFNYKGVNFETVKEGQLTLYRTDLPVMYKGEKLPYNFYLRTDPRELQKISFEKELRLKDNVVINSTSNFDCDGDGVIAIANILKLYQISEINVIRDENATCDVNGSFMFVRLQEGNETSIEKFGPACYNININNCEVLKGTERFMMESFVEINKLV